MAITKGGGKYAQKILSMFIELRKHGFVYRENIQDLFTVSASLASSGLQDDGANAEKNYDLLCQYIQLSMKNKHFIGFAAKCMKDNDLTQERFSLLMLDETHPIGSDGYNFFAKIFSFGLPDPEPNYAAIDFWPLIRSMIHLREYIDSYLSDEEQREAIGYLLVKSCIYDLNSRSSSNMTRFFRRRNLSLVQ